MEVPIPNLLLVMITFPFRKLAAVGEVLVTNNAGCVADLFMADIATPLGLNTSSFPLFAVLLPIPTFTFAESPRIMVLLEATNALAPIAPEFVMNGFPIAL